MNDQLQQTINQILQTAISTAQKTGVWLSNQLPDVIQQLLRWTVAKDVTECVIVFLFILFSILFFRWAFKQFQIWAHPESKNNNRYSYDFSDWSWAAPFCIGGALDGILAIVGIVTFLSNIFEIIEIYVAPKVWLLEYAANLFQSSK